MLASITFNFAVCFRRNIVRLTIFAALSTGLFLTMTAAQAGLIVASGAGSLPSTAQDLTGTYVTEIQGTLSGADSSDVNVFALDILDAGEFSAITVDAGPFGVPDTELFLFDSAGNGVYFNDDIDGSNTLSCLPSSDPLTNPCPATSGGLGPLTPGEYYLAITRSFNGPLDALFNEIFTNSSSTDVVGPNPGVGPVAGWDLNGVASPNFDLVNYDILLTGTTPEPATWSMFGLAGVAMAAFGLYRRRRTA
jgi:hypothetical protein